MPKTSPEEEVPDDVAAMVRSAVRKNGKIVFLTGAGISAESGIPTFRGPEGFWTVGSAVYRPEEVATEAFFSVAPDDQWPWYLWRRSMCAKAVPNAAHLALKTLNDVLGARFRLITQNVDGLHRSAGHDPREIFEIHGNIHFMRCSTRCTDDVVPIPEALADWPKERRLTDADRTILLCPRCGAWMRPHVLWFDEFYDEIHFREKSALRAAMEASLLVVVGTMGATNLPMTIGKTALESGATLIDLNIEESVFGESARRWGRGGTFVGPAGKTVPAIVALILSTSAVP